MIWKILSVFLLIVIIGGTAFAVYQYANPRSVNEKDITFKNNYVSDKDHIDIEFETIAAVTKAPKKLEELYVTGWIPDWDIADGMNSLASRSGSFHSISPVWFFLNEDGTLKKTSQTNGTNQIKFFQENSIALIPSIQEFDDRRLSKVLNLESGIPTLISQIVTQTVENNYAGIDLDFEGIQLKDKHLFFEFLENLSSEFRKINKTLVFTALPAWSDYFVFGSFPQTMRVQDYKRIADLVDEFRIMAYEFSGPRSLNAGPVQPLEWQEQIIRYSIYKGVPREKIVLGVATYSYDWTNRPVLENIDLKGRTKFSGPAPQYELGVSLTNSSIDKIKTEYAYTEIFNETWGEMILRYNYLDHDRIVVYPTNKSIELRKQLAAEYGIKGVAYWRIGDENNLKY